MDERDLARLRLELEDFTAELSLGLPRADQRATTGTNLRGLMLDGRPEHAPTYGAEQERLEQAAASLASHLSAGRFDELVTSGAGNDLPAAAVIVLESVHQLIAR